MTTGSNWILAVLEDLESYANKNDLQRLANEIRATKDTAKAEIARKAGAQRLLNETQSW